MPVQNSPSAKSIRSQRHQAVLNPTARARLDRTPSVHQLSANWDRGAPMEGAAPSRRGGDEEWDESVEKEEFEEAEVEAALAGASEAALAGASEAAVAGASEASEAPNLAHENQPLVSQDEPNFLKMME
ncbi:hypothetical protein O181_090111 [Austropuccinia psidii MF-1]|uniref:Uncharacterized protein n=1 Tax=Austropuccinia psidii MF-1 TaxID=1389203 RepID=A0A9Q3IUY0_9BASI|nr:hypothetical protein [Austropuccinia psidii MF-1]